MLSPSILVFKVTHHCIDSSHQHGSGDTAIPGRCATTVVLKGPLANTDEDDDDDDGGEGGHGGRGVRRQHWGSVGEVQVQFELLPKALAEERRCGSGREEPNAHPTLPPPKVRYMHYRVAVAVEQNIVEFDSTLVAPCYSLSLLLNPT